MSEASQFTARSRGLSLGCNRFPVLGSSSTCRMYPKYDPYTSQSRPVAGSRNTPGSMAFESSTPSEEATTPPSSHLYPGELGSSDLVESTLTCALVTPLPVATYMKYRSPMWMTSGARPVRGGRVPARQVQPSSETSALPPVP